MKKLFYILICVSVIVTLGVMSASAEADTTGLFTISYHLDGGTNALKNPDVYTSEDVVILKDATKEGYNFAGWFLDSTQTEQISEISNRTGNLNLYAKFTPKSYTATFNDGGATKSSDLIVTLDNSIGIIKTIKINNGDNFDPYSYWIPSGSAIFKGWYNGTELVSGAIDITSDITLTAKWASKYSTPGFSGAIILNDSTVGISNYSGSRFYTESKDGSTSHVGSHESSYNDYGGMEYVYVYVDGKYEYLTYEAKWGDTQDGAKRSYCEIYDVTNQKHLVTFTPSLSWTSKSGSFEVDPGVLLRIGVGYSIYSGYESVWGRITIGLGKCRKGAISPVNKRTTEVEFDSYINTPSVIKTGYNFLGWYDTFGNQITDTWKYTENQTFTAKWQPREYYITYNLDEGTNNPSNPLSYTIEDTITLTEPTKPGYTFNGWYSDANFTTKITTITQRTGNITLYAKFEANKYNLTLDANGGVFAPNVTFISEGVVINSFDLYEQNTITAYRPDTREGYIFAGWYENDTFTSLYTFNGTIENDITLYAKWIECDNSIIDVETIETFNISIQGKNEQLYAFVPLVDGEITVTSESNGLDLYGTFYDEDKNTLVSSDDISDNDLDFSYIYNVMAGQLYYIAVKGNTYSTSGIATININCGGDCTIKGTTYQNRQISVVYDTNYNLPPNPIRDGYDFLGWFDENDTQITDGAWSFVTDKTITAKWAIHNYVKHEEKTATCTQNGWKEYYTCTGCGYTDYEEIPALGHDITAYEEKSATCTEPGHKAYEDCSRCDYTTYVEIPVLGHNIVETVVTPPTTTSTGQLQITCTTCGHTDYEEIPMLEIVQGDLDGDGVTNIKDVLIILNAVLNNATLEGADMNGDGKTSLLDVIRVLKSITTDTEDSIIDLSKQKEDVATLRANCEYIKNRLAALSISISAHSSKCNNSACTIEEIVYDYQDQCADRAAFEAEIDELETKICELENAEKVDVQEINELTAGIEEVDDYYIGGDVILAEIARLDAELADMEDHIVDP